MLVCTLVRDRCAPAIDALTTPVLKCIGLFRCLPCRFGFPSWCLMVSRFKAFALLCAIAPPNADCIGGVCGLLLLQVVFTCRPLPLEGGRCLRNHGTAKHNTRKVCGSGPVGGGLPDEMANSPFRCLVFLQVCALVGVWWFVGTRPSRFGARLLRPCYWFSHKSCSERNGSPCIPGIVIL